MLQFHRSAALESGNVAIGSETYGVPEPNWRLHTEFILEGSGRNQLLHSGGSCLSAHQRQRGACDHHGCLDSSTRGR